jgi:hypothetical protein
MSARARTWVVNSKGDRNPKRKSVQSLWSLLELIAHRADDHGVYRSGLAELAEGSGFTIRWVQNLLDRLEAGEFVLRVPQYQQGVEGRLPTAIVLSPYADQTKRRPMLSLPKDLRREADDV